MKDLISIPNEVRQAQVIFVSHSGGKDSQAMLGLLIQLGFKDRLVIVHSDLGDMEWEPMTDWIKKNSFDLPVHTITPNLDFFDLCRKRKRLPSGMAQFCTNELKTVPINNWIKEYCKRNNITRAISAIGIRAEESKRRSTQANFEPCPNASLVRQNILTHTWRPIINFTLSHVDEMLRLVNQEKHPIYAQGFSRLSCAFCVNGRVSEHQLAAKLRPELFAKMSALELELNRTIRTKQINGQKVRKFLTEYC